jgi:MFS family permease
MVAYGLCVRACPHWWRVRASASEGSDPAIGAQSEPALSTASLRERLASNPVFARIAKGSTHNERILYLQMAFQSIFLGGAMAFVPVFLVRLGAENWQVGLYTSLPALLTTLLLLPAGALASRISDLVKAVNLSRLAFRSIIGLFAFVPLLAPPLAPYAVVLGRTLTAPASAMINVTMTPVLGMVIEPARRMQVISGRMAVQSLAMAMTGLMAGFWLDNASYPQNYQVLFVSGVVGCLMGVAVLSRLKVPERQAAGSAATPPRLGVREAIAMLERDRGFRSYLVASLVFRTGLTLVSAVMPVFQVRTLGASDAWIGVLLTVQRVVQMVAFISLGALLRQRRYRRRLWIAAVGMALVPLTSALAITPAMLLIPSVLTGFFTAGLTVFLTNALLASSPAEQRPLYAALNASVIQVTTFAAPMLGSLLADVIGIRVVLLISAIIRAAGGLAFGRRRAQLERERAAA